MKVLNLLVGMTLVSSLAMAQELSTTKDSSGSWKIDLGASANVMVGSGRALSDDLNGMDVAVDRPFLLIKITSPNGKVEFEGVFNTQALIARENTLNGAIPDHVIQELKAKIQLNPMLSLKAGLGSVGFGSGLEERGPRSVIPLLSEQSRYSQIKERLMAELGLTLETGTTIQVAVFDGTEQSAINSANDIRGSDFINLGDGVSRLNDSASLAVSMQQNLGKILGVDVKVSGSYAHIRQFNKEGYLQVKTGDYDQDRMALAIALQKQLGSWTIGALYQFVKVFGAADVRSHLAEVTAKYERVTLFARFEHMEETAATTTKTKSASAGVSFLAYASSIFSIEPFAVFTARQVNGGDTDWGAYLGAKVAVGTSASLGPKQSE